MAAVLRGFHFLVPRSLWLDEAMLAHTLRDFSLAAFYSRIPSNQLVPPLFAAVLKGILRWGGTSEYLLRAPALAAGLAALSLFSRLLREIGVPPRQRFLALFLFSLCEPLIYYAAELKPYMVDTFLALLLALWYLQGRLQRPSPAVALVAFLAPLASFPSALILAASLLALALQAKRVPWRLALLLAVPLALALGLFWQVARQHPGLVRYWQTGFLHLWPPASLAGSLVGIPLRFFKFLLGIVPGIWMGFPSDPWPVVPPTPAFLAYLGLVAFALFLFVLGLFAKPPVPPAFATFLKALVLLLIGAGALRLYPLSGRLLLFLVPFALLYLARGVDTLFSRASGPGKLGAVPALLFLGYFLATGVYHLRVPRARDHLKGLLQALGPVRTPVLVYQNAWPQVLWYALLMKLPLRRFHAFADTSDLAVDSLAPSGAILFSAVNPRNRHLVPRIHRYLEKRGFEVVRELQATGARLWWVRGPLRQYQDSLDAGGAAEPVHAGGQPHGLAGPEPSPQAAGGAVHLNRTGQR